jgi:hypothetical protein
MLPTTSLPASGDPDVQLALGRCAGVEVRDIREYLDPTGARLDLG